MFASDYKDVLYRLLQKHPDMVKYAIDVEDWPMVDIQALRWTLRIDNIDTRLLGSEKMVTWEHFTVEAFRRRGGTTTSRDAAHVVKALRLATSSYVPKNYYDMVRLTIEASPLFFLQSHLGHDTFTLEVETPPVHCPELFEAETN